MNTRSRLLPLALIATLAACSDEIPPHSHPDPEPPPAPREKLPARIEAFSIEPALIAPGGKATLTWTASNAVTVSIRDSAGSGVPGVIATAQSGSVEVAPGQTTSYVLSVVGESGNDFAIRELRVTEDPTVVPEAPLLLAAVPSEISAGEAAFLVWNGPGAVTITSDSGATLDTKGKVSGSLSVGSMDKTTIFTASSGAQQSSATVSVLPAIGKFVATPASSAAGETITISWISGGASDSLTLSERSRGVLFTVPANSRAEGSYRETIPANLAFGTVLDYVLTATNPSGVRTATLKVVVSAVPTISELNFDKPIVTKGGTTNPKLSWKTTNAAQVFLYAGAEGVTPNSLIYKAAGSTALTTYEIQLPAGNTDYELLAQSAQGGQTSQRISLKVVDAPAITTFTATPTLVATGGVKSNLKWTTAHGTELTITTPGGSIATSTSTPATIASGSLDVYPGQTTEYELTVTNEARDKVTQKATVTVTAPLQITFTPPIAVAGDDVTMSWDFSAIANSVVGAPNGAELPGNDPFIDISGNTDAKQLTSLTTTGTTAVFTKLVLPNGFKFRHYGTLHGEVTVSNHGWIGFGSQTSGTKPTAIKNAAAPNNFIAPFAESLKNGKVFWELQGVAPNRRLIIQWNEMASATANSRFTFEAVLGETGQVDFHYDVMDQGTASSAFKPIVGVENQNGSDGILATFHGTDATAIPEAGDHAVFFGPAPATGNTVIKAIDATFYVLHVGLTTGGTATVGAGVPLVTPGVLRITEIMPKPVSSATAGQWIEIYNTGTAALPLDAFHLETTSVPSNIQLPAGVIAPGAFAVIGQSTNQSDNGGTPVTLASSSLAIAENGDTLKLILGSTSVSTFSFDSATLTLAPGQSVIRGSGLGAPFCASTSPYGGAGSTGSPGSAGTDHCGGYQVSSLAANYVNILGTGTVHMNNDWQVRKKLTFPSGFKFPFEGVDRTAVMMGGGYLNFDTTLTDTALDGNRAPPTTFPSTEAKARGGIIAVFWDETGSNGAIEEKYLYQYFDPDGIPGNGDAYLILQWHQINLVNIASPFGDFNYQVWLYENGNIDFQYGTMLTGGGSGATPGRERGASAAIGISNVAGTAAEVIGFKQPVVEPNSGIRIVKH